MTESGANIKWSTSTSNSSNYDPGGRRLAVEDPSRRRDSHEQGVQKLKVTTCLRYTQTGSEEKLVRSS